jgi:hypothetical protein
MVLDPDPSAADRGMARVALTSTGAPGGLPCIAVPPICEDLSEVGRRREGIT